MKKLVIGILAHVDSGKTTLSEAMLAWSGQLKVIGRVDHGNSFLDTDSLERKRGITIFSKQAIIATTEAEITVMDTPGHVDFSSEMERTLNVLDYAILVVSGSQPVQSHTRTLFHLLRTHQIPTFVFVNKMDLAIKNCEELTKELSDELGEGFIDFCSDTKELSADIMEEIAIYDEEAMNQFLTRGCIEDELIGKLIHRRKIFPCFFGSALKENGIDNFMSMLSSLTIEPERKNKFSSKVYKIARDSEGQRLSYMKVTGGQLEVRQTICGEKVNQIRIYSGDKFESVATASPGQICAITGPANTFAGQGLGEEEDIQETYIEPAMTYQIILPKDVDPLTGYTKLKLLQEEDPKLNIIWNQKAEKINIKIMGKVQMEVLAGIIKRRFGWEIEFAAGEILYKETIKGSVEGVGHFEPLRHYAEVHLLIEEGKRGSGLTFENNCSEDILEQNWQKLILHHLGEKPHLGVLTGAPITDVKITLVSGKANKNHTEGGDFRQATYRAVRQGLMQAESILLEPWYEFEMKLPSENVGRGMTDIQNMGGTFDPLIQKGDMAVLQGMVPVSAVGDYQLEVSGYTGGRGFITYRLAGYEPCREQGQIVSEKGYNPEHDVENSADSIFCKRGAGVTIKWDEVCEHMHLPCYFKEEKNKKNDETENFNVKAFHQKSMENEKELMAIFEHTYGPIKNRIGKDARTISDTDSENSKLNNEKPTNTADSEKLIKTKNGIKKEEYLLVDGYNVIHDWPELKELLPVDYGAARDKLVDILANYQGFIQCKLLVVFDAYKVKGGVGSYEKIGGVDVVYTKEAETADMYIEKVTHQIGKKHNVRVVTSDSLEQMIITGHGALKTSSEAFRIEVENVATTIREIAREHFNKNRV